MIHSDSSTPKSLGDLEPLSAVTSYEETKGKRKIPIVFRWDSGGNEVYVCGEFNNWETKIPLTNRCVYVCVCMCMCVHVRVCAFATEFYCGLLPVVMEISQPLWSCLRGNMSSSFLSTGSGCMTRTMLVGGA